MQIHEANIQDITAIQAIAKSTWIETYSDIISKDQIDYMLKMMYSKESLVKQFSEQNHHFLLIKQINNLEYEGFVSFEFDYLGTASTKIHKLYVLPNSQGYGMGRILIDTVCRMAKEHGNRAIRLNMNRNNSATDFYRKNGFVIITEEDIDIGNGYLMEDYVFEKKIV